jgi:hypothetical protein
LAQYDTGKGQIGLTNVKKLGVGINALIFRGIPIGHKANILSLKHIYTATLGENGTETLIISRLRRSSDDLS